MFNKFHTLFFSTFIVLFVSSASLGQTTLYFDDFDSYTAGVQLACQNPVDWTTWSSAPCGAEDMFVTDVQAFSGANSFVSATNQDIVKPLGTLTSGKYRISFYIYIPTGHTGYFNTLSITPQTGATVWGMQVYLEADSAARMAAGGNNSSTWTYLYDTWQSCVVIVDLDLDQAEFWFDGVLIQSWQWTLGTFGSGSPLQLDGNNFFGALATDQMFVDDYRFEQLGPVPISYAIEDLDGDFVPDHFGETVTVQGVVFSPNYQTGNGHSEFYIWDEVAESGAGTSRGTIIFTLNTLFNWQPGDLLEITGEVDQFNGKTEIAPPDSSGWVLLSSGNPTPGPIVLTIAQYLADPEAYEGSLVGFESLTLVGGTWPTSSSTNLDFSDGVDTISFRIDSDTDIPGQPEPTWPQDILGVGSQFDSGTPPDGGYQLFPRYYATDFLPAGTIPVELTSFTAQVSGRTVQLNWSTATELNNHGFEIERRSDGQYRTIGFVQGIGTSSEMQNYSFADTYVQTGTYSYRLKQVDFNGIYEYSNVVEVVIAPDEFVLQQNYPNPFNPSTRITFNLAVNSDVSLKIFDVLGQEVANLISANLNAGVHDIDFDASGINSGVYFYKIEVNGIDGSTFTDVKKMILAK